MKSLLKSRPIGGLALPHHDDLPACPDELSCHLPVPSHILSELLLPEVHIAFRRIGEPTASMAVPEASVHEYDGPVAREDDVRAAGQSTRVQAESEPKSM